MKSLAGRERGAHAPRKRRIGGNDPDQEALLGIASQFCKHQGAAVDRSSPVAVVFMAGIVIEPKSPLRKMKLNVRLVISTVIVGTGPPGRPAKPKPVPW